ncbi:MAG: hypothetical protein BJ554DRAFT_1787 [Olpidium bornovanus]|uniref:Ribosomal protein S4 n=1 Tax=Olpidium bornovanus TaxID=278681 RepID=A0A8H7ZR68_9FUNG|nr:MAG: hypothetical protein BJ554DRAFT_1787 [Olpidium bornovanus]
MPRYNMFCPQRALIRMSWDPRNLFNLARRSLPLALGQKATVFQRHWLAKKETRAYFAPFLQEKSFRRFWFEPRLRVSTVARTGGVTGDNPSPGALAFAPIERRADVVLHRALFTSDVIKAKVAIWLKKVKLNGKMTNPARVLKDGDMLQICASHCALLSKTSTKHGHEFNNVPHAAPFMFVPEYLDVNYAARTVVFLREPALRANRVEIPSPHSPEMMMHAFEFYRKHIKKRLSYERILKKR